MQVAKIFIGIDVSKLTLDLCLIMPQQTTAVQLKNTPVAISAFFRKMLKTHPVESLCIAMENTGYYNWPCYEVFLELALPVFVIPALHLKRSMGLVRGKNDQLDAARIARFIQLHHQQLEPTLLARKQIRLLQALLAQRKRLVNTHARLKVPGKELALMADRQLLLAIEQSNEQVLTVIKQQIKEVDKQIMTLILADEELALKYQRITSVQGVGKVLACNLLVKTNEFKSIHEHRKLACYAGVVPFEQRSGTTVYKRPGVSYMADKSLKMLLHMAAMSAIQLQGDIQTYYNRKVDQGKPKMAVLNAVRNKIIARVCAVIRNDKDYQSDLHLS